MWAMHQQLRGSCSLDPTTLLQQQAARATRRQQTPHGARQSAAGRKQRRPCHLDRCCAHFSFVDACLAARAARHTVTPPVPSHWLAATTMAALCPHKPPPTQWSDCSWRQGWRCTQLLVPSRLLVPPVASSSGPLFESQTAPDQCKRLKRDKRYLNSTSSSSACVRAY